MEPRCHHSSVSVTCGTARTQGQPGPVAGGWGPGHSRRDLRMAGAAGPWPAWPRLRMSPAVVRGRVSDNGWA